MDLFEAFGLTTGAIVTAVGGGGKTSLVFGLASEAAERGLAAVVTTSVKFTRPPGMEMPQVIESPAQAIVGTIRSRLEPGKAVVASSGPGNHGRMLGFDPGVIDGLAALGAGIVTIEGDGSAQRPFKAPAAHEPVIPLSTTDVIVCVGLEVLGRPLDERAVHRPEIVAELSESEPGAPVSVSTVLRVLLHPNGGRKGVPQGARLHALLNNPRTAEHEAMGVHVAERLVYGGYTTAVVAMAHLPGGVRAVVR